MATIKLEDLDGLLQDALDSPFGIKVETDNPALLRQRLYQVRSQEIDLYRSLSFHSSPDKPETELWIKRNFENAEEEPATEE